MNEGDDHIQELFPFYSYPFNMDYDAGFQSAFIDFTGIINPSPSPDTLWLKVGETYGLFLAHISKIP